MPKIYLDSGGGDVESAMAIGRMLRQGEGITVLYENMTCASACVLIYAAGISRTSSGKIGIHRPYFFDLESNLSTSEIRKVREHLAFLMKEYLNEMDVATSLVDEMLSIPPESIKILSYDELVKYRLWGQDANYEEQMTAKSAARFGITSSEMRRRSLVAEKKCNPYDRRNETWLYGEYLLKNLDEVLSCQDSIYWGLDISEFKIRSKSLQFLACKALRKKEYYSISDRDTNIGQIIKCEQRIMLSR